MEKIEEFRETQFRSSPLENATDCKRDTSEKKLSEKSHLRKLELDKQYLMKEDVANSLTNLADSAKTSSWRLTVIVVSWFSIIATLAIGVSEFVVAIDEDSSAAFGLAFEAVLDVLTSAVVLWRYYRVDDTFSQVKENLSCLILGTLFTISSIGIAVKAIINLIENDTLNMSERGIQFLLTTTSVAAAVCVVLFVLKIVLAKKLLSWTLLSDALNSLMGGIIAFSMIATTTLAKSNPYLWFLDSTVGLCVSLILLVYGMWLLVKHIPRLQKTRFYKQTE